MLGRVKHWVGIGSKTRRGTTEVTVGTDAPEVHLATSSPVTLPAAPKAELKFYVKNLTGGTLTISRNGKNIEDSATDLTMSNLSSVTLIYEASGWYIL